MSQNVFVWQWRTGGFLFFVPNFNMTLAVSETLEAGAKYKYLRNLVRREALRKFDSLYADVEGTETLNVDYLIRGLEQ